MHALAPRPTTFFLAFLLLAGAAPATERHLTYTYGSDVLNPGTIEVEPWTTVRAGKDDFFFALDNRVEIEAGVTERYQVALYLNASQTLFDSGQGSGRSRTSTFSWKGVSMEHKLKLLDAAADAVGLALYVEPTLFATELEVEGKLIVDKRLGALLLAANLVAEYAWEFGALPMQRELKLEVDAGLSCFLTPYLSVGLEARSHTVLPAGEGRADSALFAGPVISLSSKAVWAALSVLPQLASLRGNGLDLQEHERLQARLLVGFHL